MGGALLWGRCCGFLLRTNKYVLCKTAHGCPKCMAWASTGAYNKLKGYCLETISGTSRRNENWSCVHGNTILNGLEGLVLYVVWQILPEMFWGPSFAHLFGISGAKWRIYVFKDGPQISHKLCKRGPDHNFCSWGTRWEPMGPPGSRLQWFWFAFVMKPGSWKNRGRAKRGPKILVYIYIYILYMYTQIC